MKENTISHEKRRRRKALAKTEPVNVKFSKSEKRNIEAYCDKNGLTISFLVREAVAHAIRKNSLTVA